MEKRAWHPAYCSATEYDLRKYKEHLTFIREYQLSKEPLHMDMLIIKKEKNIQIDNDIGRIFKEHNIIEYKSPYDHLNIDTFYKLLAYGCLYKATSSKVNEIDSNEITLSIIRDEYPRKLISELKRQNAKIEKKLDGIYYVSGKYPFSIQLIVLNQIGPDNKGLRALLEK